METSASTPASLRAVSSRAFWASSKLRSSMAPATSTLALILGASRWGLRSSSVAMFPPWNEAAAAMRSG